MEIHIELAHFVHVLCKIHEFNFAQNFLKKVVAIADFLVYNDFCCGMIAVKREVAADMAGVPWSECQVRKLTTSHCTNKKPINR